MRHYYLLFICCLFLQIGKSQTTIDSPSRIVLSYQPTDGNYIMNWNAQTYVDDEWHKSRIPLAERFSYAGSQVDQTLTTDRKYFFWSYISDLLTRGTDKFNLDVWHYLQYRDSWGIWYSGGKTLQLPHASHVDACHRNGVKALALVCVAHGTSSTDQSWKNIFLEQNGEFIHAKKTAEICTHYGIDGLMVNIEVDHMYSTADVTATDCIEWLQTVKQEAAALGYPDFEIGSYYVYKNSGQLSFGIKAVESDNQNWFHYNNKITNTIAFINYDWDAGNYTNFDQSISIANNLGRRSYDIYAGTDFYGRSQMYGEVKSRAISLGFWGEPLPAVNLPNSTDQEKVEYRIEQFEKYFSGPTGDPKDALDAFTTNLKTNGFGLADMYPARSTIDSWPFSTRFTTGQGKMFRENGQTVHSNNWSDYGVCDVMPTWMWWWSQGGTNLEAKIDHDDPYYAGSSIKISGDITDNDNLIRLYKTKLPITSNSKCILTYKVSDTQIVDSHLELAIAFENGANLSQFSYIPVGNTIKTGWNTIEFDLSAYSGQTLATVGLNISGSQTNYGVNLGELILTNNDLLQPEAPINVVTTQLLDFGTTYTVRLDWDLPNVEYNQDADVDYFEIYEVNPDNDEKQLIGKSVHRGFIGRDIPYLPNNTNIQFEVVSVAADGRTKSTDIVIINDLVMEYGVASVNDAWQTINLTNSFTSPVVVTTPVLTSVTELPVCVRVRNASATSFELKLQAAGSHATGTRDVHYIVVEEGVYNQTDHGVKMEAVNANSTKTWYKWSPTTNLETRAFQNAYTNPVVVGQVMTNNDADFSIFWCSNNSASSITPSSFCAGKQVCEDTDQTRLNETIGYIVIEEGTGVIDDIPYVAQNSDNLVGIDNNNAGVTYNLPTNNLLDSLVAVATIDGMLGSNGGWANLKNASPVSSSAITLTIDEDVIADTERVHIAEKVNYLVVGKSTSNSNSIKLKSEISTSLDDEINKSIEIYPNPCEDVLYINDVNADAFYHLYTLTGKCILKGQVANGQINMAMIKKGVYILELGKNQYKVLKK